MSTFSNSFKSWICSSEFAWIRRTWSLTAKNKEFKKISKLSCEKHRYRYRFTEAFFYRQSCTFYLFIYNQTHPVKALRQYAATKMVKSAKQTLMITFYRSNSTCCTSVVNQSSYTVYLPCVWFSTLSCSFSKYCDNLWSTLALTMQGFFPNHLCTATCFPVRL